MTFFNMKSIISPSSVQDVFFAKSDLLDLEDLAAAHLATFLLNIQAVIIDSAAVVSMLKPGPATKTFLHLANQQFFTNIKNHTYNMRVYIIWDRYFTESLKTETRLKRGKGVRLRVEPATRVPETDMNVSVSKKTKRSCSLFLPKL